MSCYNHSTMCFLAVFVAAVSTASCTNMNGMFDNKEAVRFSAKPNHPVLDEKEYKRVTRKTLETESDLSENAGSLWKTEGQNPYLFAQNRARMAGDLVNIRMEGVGLKQIETKVQVLKDLINQLEAKQKASEVTQPTAQNSNSPDAKPATPTPAPEPVGESKSSLAGGGGEPLVTTVPARIVDQLTNGTYRVKGSQPFMIGQREYKVIVSGLVRSEDFNEMGMSSNQLLEPQFDVVGLKKVVK